MTSVVDSVTFTLQEQALATIVYLMLKQNKINDPYVDDEMTNFYCTLYRALEQSKCPSLETFEKLLTNELIEGGYFEEEDFKDQLCAQLEHCADELVVNYVMGIVDTAEKLWLEAEERVLINDGNFAVVQWSHDDLEHVFSKHDIPWTEANIQKFLGSRAPRSLVESSIEAGWEILDELVVSLQEDGVLPKSEDEKVS